MVEEGRINEPVHIIIMPIHHGRLCGHQLRKGNLFDGEWVVSEW